MVPLDGNAEHDPASAFARIEALQRQRVEQSAQTIAAFPYRRIEVPGREALATWQRLRAERSGWPVVVGGDFDLLRVAEALQFDGRSIEEIVAKAASLEHPAALERLRAEEEARALENLNAVSTEELRAAGDAQPGTSGAGPGPMARSLPEILLDLADRWLPAGGSGLGLGDMLGQMPPPPIGEWPADPGEASGLSVARGLEGKPLDRVHIVVLPTDDGAAVPAFLKWGGWNACPPAEYHVAALRSWHRRYGAELVGLSGDVMNLRVERRPPDRETALDLAREHFDYCEDIVLQGTEAFAPLAAALMHHDWWYFWWD